MVCLELRIYIDFLYYMFKYRKSKVCKFLKILEVGMYIFVYKILKVK
jgi:hypothetical protein